MVEIDQNRNMNMKDLDPREEGRARPEPNDELQKIQIEVVAKIFSFSGQGLPEAMKSKLMNLLRRNSDIFAQAPKDMLGIYQRVIFHRLVIDPKVSPMAQKKWKLKSKKTKGRNEQNKEITESRSC